MGTDKLWVDLWGRPAWRWSLDVLLSVGALERIAIAVPPDGVERFSGALPPGSDRCIVVPGGEVRADSVIAGLWALTRAGYDDDTLVLVHDAARPAVRRDLVSSVLEAIAGVDGAVVPVVPVADSLKRIRNDRVAGPIDRDEVAAAQTPQAARLGALRAAIEEAHAWGRPITDDAGALAAAGVPVHVVEGDPDNRKLTEPGDVLAVRALLADRALATERPPFAAQPPIGGRIGIGFDAHRLEVGRPMRLAGVVIEDSDVGLAGHSDGDAALHAVVDALLGAAALGDIGALFPADDVASGTDSIRFVEEAVERLHAAGWRPASVDVTIAAARPAIAPHRDAMRERLARLLEIDPPAVSVKGTTSDGLGFAGEEGVAAWAVAVVEPAG